MRFSLWLVSHKPEDIFNMSVSRGCLVREHQAGTQAVMGQCNGSCLSVAMKSSICLVSKCWCVDDADIGIMGIWIIQNLFTGVQSEMASAPKANHVLKWFCTFSTFLCFIDRRISNGRCFSSHWCVWWKNRCEAGRKYLDLSVDLFSSINYVACEFDIVMLFHFTGLPSYSPEYYISVIWGTFCMLCTCVRTKTVAELVFH